MTDTQNQELDGSVETDGDSAVIADFRKREAAKDKRIAELEKQVEGFNAQAAEQRRKTIEGVVNDLGFPGLVDDVDGWVEGDVTADAIASVLKAKGLLTDDAPATGTSSAPEQPQQSAEQPAKMPASRIGQQVAAAASGSAGADISERLAAAKTNAEIAEIMAEAGAVTQYT